MRLALLAVLLLAPSLARADKVEAAACADTLAPDAKLIYDAAARDYASAIDPRVFLRDRTNLLVQMGKISGVDARKNSTAAGECLKKLRLAL